MVAVVVGARVVGARAVGWPIVGGVGDGRPSLSMDSSESALSSVTSKSAVISAGEVGVCSAGEVGV